MGIEIKKRYALLLACKDSEYVKEVYGGYFNVFVDTYGEEGESWELFRVVEGDFPNMEELENYDGFVVSGSPYDAYGNDNWILELCFLLQTLNVMRKKVLGICFGHQVLCRALGGKVGKASSGWDLGLRKVRIVKDFLPYNFYGRFYETPSSLSIIECHQDEVWEVPLEAKVIAYSEKTRVEMFSIGDHILGIQGHPEYTNDILNNLIDRLLHNYSIEKECAEEAKSKLRKAEPDRKCWQRICKLFLKGGPLIESIIITRKLVFPFKFLLFPLFPFPIFRYFCTCVHVSRSDFPYHFPVSHTGNYGCSRCTKLNVLKIGTQVCKIENMSNVNM